MLEYEEMPDGNKKRKLFKRKELSMDSKVKAPKHPKVDKKKTTLSIYTYLNWKRFGVSVAIEDGIKVNVLWFETHIKFEKR